MTHTQAVARPKLSETHGHPACYTISGCRCRKCTAAATRYAKQRKLLIGQGEWQPWSAANPVRRHITALQAIGIGRDTIGRIAGVNPSTLDELFRSGRPRIRTLIAEKILAVQPALDVLPDWARTDGTGTRRRLQALMVAGWSAQAIATRLGMDRQTIGKILGTNMVRARTARAVRDLFTVMWDKPPPSTTRHERASATRVRDHAARQKWAPAAAWDAIDDPQATPRGLLPEVERVRMRCECGRTLRLLVSGHMPAHSQDPARKADDQTCPASGTAPTPEATP